MKPLKFKTMMGFFLIAGVLSACAHSGQSVYFSSGSYQLDMADKKVIRSVAATVQAKQRNMPVKHMKDGGSIHLTAFTDNVGSEELNKRLAEKRLDAVRQELVHLGVDPQYITSTAYGKGGWMNKDKNQMANEKLRRVDLNVY